MLMQAQLTKKKGPTPGAVDAPASQVHPSTPVRTVAELFFRCTDLIALALVDDGEPVGLITRSRLLFTLSRRFGLELYGSDPILVLADTEPLTVIDEDPIGTVVSRALKRPPATAYDDIIVIDVSCRFRRLLSVMDVLAQQATALEQSVLLQETSTERIRMLDERVAHHSRFLTDLLRELLAPANVILGLAELLRVSLKNGDYELAKEHTGQIASSASNLRSHLATTLGGSTPGADALQVSLERFDLAGLISEIAENARTLAHGKHSGVETWFPSQPFFIESDPARIRQVLTYLAVSAAQEPGPGPLLFVLSAGSHSVSISVIAAGSDVRTAGSEFRLSDLSSGSDAPHRNLFSAAGVGLATARNVARLLDGEITSSGVPGKGSTCTFSIPHRVIEKEVSEDETQKNLGH